MPGLLWQREEGAGKENKKVCVHAIYRQRSGRSDGKRFMDARHGKCLDQATADGCAGGCKDQPGKATRPAARTDKAVDWQNSGGKIPRKRRKGKSGIQHESPLGTQEA